MTDPAKPPVVREWTGEPCYKVDCPIGNPGWHELAELRSRPTREEFEAVKRDAEAYKSRLDAVGDAYCKKVSGLVISEAKIVRLEEQIQVDVEALAHNVDRANTAEAKLAASERTIIELREIIRTRGRKLAASEAEVARWKSSFDGHVYIKNEEWGDVWDRLRASEAERERLRALVNEQAEDEGLWFKAEYITEAYLQQALRKLHALIEGDELALAALAGKDLSPGTTGALRCRYCSGDHDPEWHLSEEGKLRRALEAANQEIGRLRGAMKKMERGITAVLLDAALCDPPTPISPKVLETILADVRNALAPAARPEGEKKR